ncbi:MAG TPA: phosphonate metabolism protein/1,5-bisphosphokinase (PRPP-forming) PhnN, partial [Stellaceae bacterium]|nr:phosphonate metabolism protein/1,5-bisphosphokinase (PRPP-forming) PhnN [Stellaceae bacterium]
AQRLITRAATAGGEDHIEISPAAFAERRQTGQLMLHWHAHGLDYGLPAELLSALESGKTVVANVSRGVVAEARERLAPVLVVAVTASPETLAVRLAGRGRESTAEIEGRLRRADALSPGQADVVISNDGALETAVEKFAAVIRRTLAQPASG